MRFDAIVIGTGQAGPPLARALADKGWKVAIAEGGTFGGSCVNYGCTPSKAMIGSARAIHMARRGADFGFNELEVTTNYPAVAARRDAIVQRSRDGLIGSLENRKNLSIYRHYAAFEGPHSVRVGDEVIEGDKIFLNTGTRAAIPPIEGLDHTPYFDNISLMGLRELPQHLIIVGGGYIGLELGQAYRRFGSEVTVIDHSPRLIEHEDPDFSKAVHKVLTEEGVRILDGSSVLKAEPHGTGIRLQVQQQGARNPQWIKGSHLLIATGRRPNSDQIGADKAGLELDARGFVKVDDHLRTNVDGIFALGDVNGRGAFTHTSYNDFQIAESLLLGDGSRKVSDRILIYGMFIDPPLGRVGMNETDVRKSGRKALMATMPMTNVARAREFGQTEGFMKVLVDAETEQFLGATLFGMSGDELVHLFADLMYAKAPYTVLKNAVHIHPTVGELLVTLVEGLQPLK